MDRALSLLSTKTAQARARCLRRKAGSGTLALRPPSGRALDADRITVTGGITVGIVLTAAGLALALLPGLVGLVSAAIVIGAGCGLITPLAFTMLARSTPQDRLGQTMGAAEIGELAAASQIAVNTR